MFLAPFFTLTPTPFDKLTALSQSKGSPLTGDGDYGEDLNRLGSQ